MVSIFCPNCGEEIAIHSRRCPYCGFKNRRNLIKYSIKKFLSKVSFKISKVVTFLFYAIVLLVITASSSEYLLGKLKGDWKYITFYSDYLGKDRVDKIDKYLYQKNLEDNSIHNKIKEANILSPLVNKKVQKDGKSSAEYDMPKQREIIKYLYSPENANFYNALKEADKFSIALHPFNYADPPNSAASTPILSVFDLPVEKLPKSLFLKMDILRILYLIDAVAAVLAIYLIYFLLACIPLCILRDVVKKYITCIQIKIVRD